MSAELWLGIGHYLLGVFIIFALVVALMEASRKYDRFREAAYLLQASGYFLLVIWALLQAMSLTPTILLTIATICQTGGMVLLAIGYFMYYHEEAEDEDDAQSVTHIRSREHHHHEPKIERAPAPAPTPAPAPSAPAGPSSAEIDLSYLADRKGKKKTSPAKRAKLMDDLFPVDEKEDAVKKKLPVVLSLGLTGIDWLLAWPEVATTVLSLVILLIIVPQRQHKGNGWLIVGFSLVIVASVIGAMASPELLGPLLEVNTGTYGYLLSRLLLVLGFLAVGYSSWLKIKGKVTHHFLRIVSWVYLILLFLTVGLAAVIVTDAASLQLLLVLMTGVLIIILPIIHSLTYSHPHQPPIEQPEQTV